MSLARPDSARQVSRAVAGWRLALAACPRCRALGAAATAAQLIDCGGGVRAASCGIHALRWGVLCLSAIHAFLDGGGAAAVAGSAGTGRFGLKTAVAPGPQRQQQQQQQLEHHAGEAALQGRRTRTPLPLGRTRAALRRWRVLHLSLLPVPVTSGRLCRGGGGGAFGCLSRVCAWRAEVHGRQVRQVL